MEEGIKLKSEEDVRILIVSIFKELGVESNELSFEDSFTLRLGHSEVTIPSGLTKRGRLVGRSDILITRSGQPLVIVETKNASHKITNDDIRQAISYGRLTTTITPYAIVTNGQDTRLLDVLSDGDPEIQSPKHAIWEKNGQRFQGFADDVKYEAARLLVGLNPEVLDLFCRNQVSNALSSLKSRVSENKKYIPGLYVEREEVEKQFDSWLSSTQSVFALVGPSGYGKTNFMCAKAEELLEEENVLFYSAKELAFGLAQSIREDFIWEFIRDKSLPQIIQRVDSVVTSTEKNLFIFVDGLDEYVEGVDKFKSELIKIISRLSNFPSIKLVISCKSFDWPGFVIDDGQSYSVLAERINPEIMNAPGIQLRPDPSRIGVQLKEFSEIELDSALGKYREAYSLAGEFVGDIREESKNPLMLRFISEVYGSLKHTLPAEMTSIELYELYLERKLDGISNPVNARELLSRIAELIFVEDNRYVSMTSIAKVSSKDSVNEAALHGLIRMGILSSTLSAGNVERIGFEFHKFLLFFYMFHVLDFPNLGREAQIEFTESFDSNPLRFEAVDLFCTVGKQEDVNKYLKELALGKFSLFVKVINSSSMLRSYKKEPVPWDNIEAFLDFYNFIREEFFFDNPGLTMPYSKRKLGIILIGQVPYKFRGRTTKYPDEFVSIDDEDKELIHQILMGPVSRRVEEEINPVGMTYIGGIHDLVNFPQRFAYKEIIQGLDSAVSSSLLVEQGCQELFVERCYEILTGSPSIWMAGDYLPTQKRYFELLGFSDQTLSSASIKDLIEKTRELILDILKRNIEENTKGVSRMRVFELIVLLYSLTQVSSSDVLGERPLSVEESFGYLSGRDPTSSISSVQKIYSIVLDNFRKIFENNFERLLTYSPLYQRSPNLKFIEISWPQDAWSTDFLSLSYGFTDEEDDNSPVEVFVPAPNSDSDQEANSFESLLDNKGNWGYISNPGFVTLDSSYLDIFPEKTNTYIMKTQFPSRTPIYNQVYQLVRKELQYILGLDFFDWRHDSHTDVPTSENYVRFCIAELDKQGVFSLSSLATTGNPNP